MPLAILPLFAFLFEAPVIAAAAAAEAVSIPIIIHLLNRKRYRVVPWAAMRFLLAAQRKTSRKVRIEQLLLLAVRCLLLLLLLAAMCSVTPWAEAAWRWFAPAGVAVAGGAARTHKILVIDGSLGMGFKAGDKDAFEKARAAAKQIVHDSGGGDGFSVVLLAAPPRMIVPGPTADGDPGLPSEDAEKVLARIDELRRTDGNADLAAALTTVENLLEASPSKYVEKEVYFLTNLQRTTWVARQAAALSATVQKIQARAKTAAIIDVGQDGAENLAVEDLALADPIATTGHDTLFQAVLHNFGDTRTDVPVRAVVRKAGAEAEEAMDLPAVRELKGGEEVRVVFKYKFPDPGDYVVRFETGHDGLESDDARRVVVTVKDEAPVLLVNGKPAGQAYDQAAQYVSTALNPFQDGKAHPAEHVVAVPKVLTETQFADEGLGDLTPYDCVFLCDMPRFTEAEAHRLLAHVRRGGGVVFAVGDRVDLAAYNDVLYRAGAGLLPARLVEKQSGNEDYQYQFLIDSETGARAGLQGVHRLPAARNAAGRPLPPVPQGGAGRQGRPPLVAVVRARAAARQGPGGEDQGGAAAGRAGAAGVASAGRQGRAGRAAARPRRPVHVVAQRRLEQLAGVADLPAVHGPADAVRRRRPAARTGRRGRRADRAVPRHRRRRLGRRPHARRPGGIGPRPRPGRRRRPALVRRRRERRLPRRRSARPAPTNSSPSTRRRSTRPSRPAPAT